MEQLKDAANKAGISFSYNTCGAMFGLFFSNEDKIQSFSQVMACDSERFSKFFHAMLKNGVYLAPSAFEAGFVSSTHTEKEIEQTLAAANEAFKNL